MGCERSERQEPNRVSLNFLLWNFNDTLKPKQPHPGPPLLSQGRGASHYKHKLLGPNGISHPSPIHQRRVLSANVSGCGVPIAWNSPAVSASRDARAWISVNFALCQCCSLNTIDGYEVAPRR